MNKSQRERILTPSPRGRSFRSWGRLKPRDYYDPRLDILIECHRCKRKVGEGPLKALRLWRVKPMIERNYSARRITGHEAERFLARLPHGVPWSWNRATAECADQAECEEYQRTKVRKQREAQERRRPKLPHADAPVGTCKWCGEEIDLDQRRKGWKRRRQRSYHRGDEYERGPDRDCFERAMIWLDPKRATQALLARQAGKCAECGAEIATLEMTRVWDEATQGLSDDLRPYWEQGPGHPRLDIDHVLPVIDGGENTLENLQAICNDPCHKAKTAREAKARASARKAGLPLPEPTKDPNQMEMA